VITSAVSAHECPNLAIGSRLTRYLACAHTRTVWDYWVCHEVVWHEVAKCLLCLAVAFWLLWKVAFVVVAALAAVLILTHITSTAFYSGMFEVDKRWVAFFEHRAVDWIRHRGVLRHYGHWPAALGWGADALRSIYRDSMGRVSSPLFFVSKFSFMVAMAFGASIAGVLIVPALMTPGDVSPRDLWMLSSMLTLFVSSAGRVAYYYGKFILTAEGLRSLHAELAAGNPDAPAAGGKDDAATGKRLLLW
jgi:hypothetical protein